MEKDKDPFFLRLVIGSLSMLGLICVFVFQQINFAGLFVSGGPSQFFVNRTVRFFLNDGLTIALIWALFYKREYVIFSLWVQLFGFSFVLIPYFILKLYFPSYNGPLLSFMHRLILNPTLLLLLIPAFYYQRQLSGRRKTE